MRSTAAWMGAMLGVVLLECAVGAWGVACRDSPGATLTGRTGVVSEGDGDYVNYMDCSLTIEPAGGLGPGEELVLSFTVGDVERGYDFVYVHAPATASTPQATFTGRFAGQTVRTTEGSMRVRFTSDYSMTRAGYEAQYAVEGGVDPTPSPTTPSPPTPSPTTSSPPTPSPTTPSPPTPSPTTPSPAAGGCTEGSCGTNGYCSGGVSCVCFEGWGGAGCTTEEPCKAPRERRGWHSLGTEERKWYQDAVQALKASGGYEIFSRVHQSESNVNYAHGTSGFLPWHRQFVWEYENALRELGGRYRCVTVPYWAWEVDAGLADPTTSEMWGPTPQGWGPAGVVGCASAGDAYYASWTASDGICLERRWNTGQQMWGEAQMAQLILQYPTFGTGTEGFRLNLEGSPHGIPHVFVGGLPPFIGKAGHMGDMRSPDDPVFFLHHANVDRLWALWQDCHDHDQVPAASIPPETYEASGGPLGGGVLDTPMPFSMEDGSSAGRFDGLVRTPRQMHSILSPELGYVYAGVDGMASQATLQSNCGAWAWFTVAGGQQQQQTLAHNKGAAAAAGAATLPRSAGAADFLRSLKRAPTVGDARTAAILECLEKPPSPLTQRWVTGHLRGTWRPEDFKSVCEDLVARRRH